MSTNLLVSSSSSPKRPALLSRRGGKRIRTCRAMLGVIAAVVLFIMAQLVLFPFYVSLIMLDHDNNQFPPTGLNGPPDSHYDFSKQNKKRYYPLPTSTSDATFNGIPLTLHRHHDNNESITSHVHCVGDNYQIQTNWKQRSCHFSNLCFNTSSQDFVLFISKQEERLAKHYFAHNPNMHVSSTILIGSHHADHNLTVPSVSLGGHNLKWGPDGMERLHWFPSLHRASQRHPVSYYALPDHMILLPFHSLNGANPGHLVWDDFLPLYTLLTMFQQLSSQSGQDDKILLPMRYVLPIDPNATDDKAYMQRGLWASCDLRDSKTEQCNHMLQKFGPLLLGNDYPYQLSTNRNFALVRRQQARNDDNDDDSQVDLVCAKTALAGISSLTDHGIDKMHGWEPEDYLTTHNHGRGGPLLEFRNFMLHNIGIHDTQSLVQQQQQRRQQRQGQTPMIRHRIIFSQKSSDIPNRSVDFTTQMRLLEQELSAHTTTSTAVVEAYTFKTLSVAEQVNAVHNASIFISLCGGGAVTAMFLPPGASVILYYSETGGVRSNVRTHEPAMLDWDLFNAMSHLRVHWMPRDSMKSERDQKALLALVRHELQLIDEQVFV